MSISEIDDIALIRLKHPFGKLLIGPPEKTIKELKDFIKCKKPTKIFVIGDVVASNIMKNNIKIDSIIIDFKSERKPTKHLALNNFKIMKVKNIPGTISSAARKAVRDTVLGSSITTIIVDGEEDLLTLPAIGFAPLGSLVIYGQPHVGIVLVQINERIRHEAKRLLRLVEKKLSIKG